MVKITRRDFIKASAASLASVVVSSVLTGCGEPSSNPRVIIQDPNQPVLGQFAQGVASGDPTQDKVILWTRITPDQADLEQAEVIWEVASDQAFSNILASGSTVATSVTDHTVKIDLQGLTAGTRYYYRFASLGAVSPIGCTKTLPDGEVEQVSLAMVSCSSYTAGHFNVYKELSARDDVDVILHLGDYIYEYGMGGYATENAEQIGRALPEDNQDEIISLADYRRRYAVYRSDQNLQRAHQNLPFISIWDDHEIANNGWMDGAENHQQDEGDFAVRKDAALQAYFEWMPIRPVSVLDQQTIFRQFDFGHLVSLYMLDTRFYGRDQSLDYADFIDPNSGELDSVAFQTAMVDPTRSMLGQEQLLWLQGRMQNSVATWQVLGQQVLMGQMYLPVEILPYLTAPSPEILVLFQELASIKQRVLLNDPTLTEAERSRVTVVAPYNLDAWDGYGVERETIFATATALNKNLVVLAGDTHNAWANNLLDMHGNQVGVEFATASVSSPGLKETLGLDSFSVGGFEEITRLLVDQLKYFNAVQRGYAIVTFNAEAARCDWHYVDRVDASDYRIQADRAHSLRMKVGEPELTWSNTSA